MPLKLKGAISDFAKPVEANGTSQGVFRLTLIQSGRHSLLSFEAVKKGGKKESSMARKFGSCPPKDVDTWRAIQVRRSVALRVLGANNVRPLGSSAFAGLCTCVCR
jgi:hypothetical protein